MADHDHEADGKATLKGSSDHPPTTQETPPLTAQSEVLPAPSGTRIAVIAPPWRALQGEFLAHATEHADLAATWTWKYPGHVIAEAVAGAVMAHCDPSEMLRRMYERSTSPPHPPPPQGEWCLESGTAAGKDLFRVIARRAATKLAASSNSESWRLWLDRLREEGYAPEIPAQDIPGRTLGAYPRGFEDRRIAQVFKVSADCCGVRAFAESEFTGVLSRVTQSHSSPSNAASAVVAPQGAPFTSAPTPASTVSRQLNPIEVVAEAVRALEVTSQNVLSEPAEPLLEASPMIDESLNAFRPGLQQIARDAQKSIQDPQDACSGLPSSGPRSSDVTEVSNASAQNNDGVAILPPANGLVKHCRQIPHRRPDVDTSRKRIAFLEEIRSELVTLKQALHPRSTGASLKVKFPNFRIWKLLGKDELKQIVEGEQFSPKAFAENLTLRKFGITHAGTLKKDRQKIRRAEQTVKQ